MTNREWEAEYLVEKIAGRLPQRMHPECMAEVLNRSATMYSASPIDPNTEEGQEYIKFRCRLWGIPFRTIDVSIEEYRVSKSKGE